MFLSHIFITVVNQPVKLSLQKHFLGNEFINCFSSLTTKSPRILIKFQIEQNHNINQIYVNFIYQNIKSNSNCCFFWIPSIRSTRTGCPGRLWSLLLWRYSRLAWTRSCAACCRQPCFGRGVGLDDPQRSLPTPTILWFYEYKVYMGLGI